MKTTTHEQAFAIGDAVLKLCGLDDRKFVTKLVLTVDYATGQPPILELTEQTIDCKGDPEKMIQRFHVEPIGEPRRTVDSAGPSSFFGDETKAIEAMNKVRKQTEEFERDIMRRNTRIEGETDVQYFFRTGIKTGNLLARGIIPLSIGLDVDAAYFDETGRKRTFGPGERQQLSDYVARQFERAHGRPPAENPQPINPNFNVLPNNGEPTAEEWYKAQQEPCAGTPQPLGIMTRVEPLPIGKVKVKYSAGRAFPQEFVEIHEFPQNPTDNRCMLACPDCLVDGVPTGEYRGLNSTEKCKTCGGTRKVAAKP